MSAEVRPTEARMSAICDTDPMSAICDPDKDPGIESLLSTDFADWTVERLEVRAAESKDVVRVSVAEDSDIVRCGVAEDSKGAVRFSMAADSKGVLRYGEALEFPGRGR